jgi:hypothetical protein
MGQVGPGIGLPLNASLKKNQNSCPFSLAHPFDPTEALVSVSRTFDPWSFHF